MPAKGTKPSGRIERQCVVCNAPFFTTRYRIENNHGKYCSRECFLNRPKTSVQCTCQHCGSKFSKNAWAVNHHNRGKYCSRQCFDTAQKIQDPTAYLLKRRIADSETGCWNWTASVNRFGYGKARYNGRYWSSHRLAAFVWLGLEPDAGSFVCHHCDNPRCINPNHLYLGNPQSNMTDKVIRGRIKRGSQTRLAKLTEDDVLKIKARIVVGERLRSIAADFNVSPATISAIKAKRNWKHIPFPSVGS